MRRKRGHCNAKERAKVFTDLAQRGKIHSTMQHAYERDKAGVIIHGDIDSKTCDLVSETLENIQLEGRDVNSENTPVLDNCLDLI